jgi:hypothetical protein
MASHSSADGEKDAIDGLPGRLTATAAVPIAGLGMTRSTSSQGPIVWSRRYCGSRLGTARGSLLVSLRSGAFQIAVNT